MEKLSWCAGRTSVTPLNKDLGISLGSGSRQSIYLTVDIRKLVIKRPVNKKQKREESGVGQKKCMANSDAYNINSGSKRGGLNSILCPTALAMPHTKSVF